MSKTRLIIAITATISIVVILIGFIAPIWGPSETYQLGLLDIRQVLVSVGSSLLAAALFAYVMQRRVDRREMISERFEKIGIDNIFIGKAGMTDAVREALVSAKTVDVIGIRLRVLIDEHQNALEKVLRRQKGVIRVILPDPDSNCAHLLKNMIGIESDFMAQITPAIDWIADIKSRGYPGAISVKFTGNPISSFYQRIDNQIFTGPYISKKAGEAGHVAKVSTGGQYGAVLLDYFEKEFFNSRDRIRQRPVVIELFGLPGAGKTTFMRELIKEFSAPVCHSNEDVDCYTTDSPYDFNERLIASMTSSLKGIPNNGILIFDRGLEDIKIWLDSHVRQGNIDSQASDGLVARIPKIPAEFKYICIFFDIPPSVSKGRRKPQRRSDEWAMEDKMLDTLYEGYKARIISPEIFTVDASLPPESVKYTVLSYIRERMTEP